MAGSPKGSQIISEFIKTLYYSVDTI